MRDSTARSAWTSDKVVSFGKAYRIAFNAPMRRGNISFSMLAPTGGTALRTNGGEAGEKDVATSVSTTQTLPLAIPRHGCFSRRWVTLNLIPASSFSREGGMRLGEMILTSAVQLPLCFFLARNWLPSFIGFKYNKYTLFSRSMLAMSSLLVENIRINCAPVQLPSSVELLWDKNYTFSFI